MISDEALQERMEYMQDVAGWKSIIFLPFQVAWQCVIMVSALYVFVTCITRVTYDIRGNMEITMLYFCDFLYLSDTVCSIMHHSLTNTRKLKTYKPRHWAFIVIDSISLLPLELIYLVVYMTEAVFNQFVWYCLILNRTLRIYRINYYFNEYELSVNSLELGIIYSFLQLKIYEFCLTHIATAIYHGVKVEEELDLFRKSPIEYVFLEEVNMYCLMTQRFIGDESYFNTTKKRICFAVFMVVGYFYLFGITLPKIMFAYQKRHRTFFDFWNRFRRLRMFVNNVIDSEALQKKILDMFRTVWTYGRGDFEPELLQSYPTNMRKNAYADIYWDAMRHSELLQNVSRSCKRSLALKMIGNFYVPNTVFWDLGENKNLILYLASGIVQIMAEENKESPIMSFSGGTILGEASLFYPGRSKAILRVATFSEIHVLQANDFFRIIKDYPKDRQIVRYNLKLRLRIARMTQVRRKEISKVIFRRNLGILGNIVADELDSVKWVKTRFRQIAEVDDMRSKSDKDFGANSSMNRQLNELKGGIEHTSLYLPLLNLGEDIEVITDQTCLKTTIPWVIDPNSPFTQHWRYIILCFTLICSVIYPLFIAWWPEVPHWLITVSELISMIYLCDIFIQLSTAIKTKDVFIAKSGPIFRYRLRRLSFYADVVSALPYQIMFQYIWKNKYMSVDKFIRISIAISLLKTYRLLSFLDEWCHTLKGRFSIRAMIKYLCYMFILIYWSAAFLHLCDVRCLLWSCENGNWYNETLEESYPVYRNLASSFYAITYLLGISTMEGYRQSFPSAEIVIISLLVMQGISVAWYGEFAGSYMAESSQKIEFRNLVQSIKAFMNEKKIAGRIMKRVLDTMQFQWVYDCGDYLTQQRAMLDDIPIMLRNEVDGSTIFQMLKKCSAFNSESEAFIWHLCRTGVRLALPAGSIVVTFGTQTMSLYVIYKGFLEVNSFLPKDIIAGVATSSTYGPGMIVPVVIAFNQMPSGVTARTLTDCELICIPLEAILVGLVLDDSLKDFVDAIKELDLRPFQQSKLVFSKVAKTTKKKDNYYKVPFKKLGCFGSIFRCFLRKVSINGSGKYYIRWEIFRVLTLIAQALIWPFAFLLPYTQERLYLVYALLGLESFTWFDFYIKMHVGYYSKKGIYIHHPLSTSSHYVSTSLILEVLVFIPYLHCIYIIGTDMGEFNVTKMTVVWHNLVRILALYRVFLFTANYSDIANIPALKTIGFFLIIFIVLNSFIVLKIWSEINWIIDPDGKATHILVTGSWIAAVKIPTADTIGEMYIVMFYCIVMLVYRGQALFNDFTADILIVDIILTFFGMIVSLLSMAFLLSRKTGSKMNFIVYQYHMKCLTHFLKVERAEDSISEEVINHFEHEWEKKKGDDLHVVFSRFPNILHEDMMYPVYRTTFLGVPCFKNANDGFFRSLARKFVEVHFRKRSVISFEKAVHKDIYFVLNGWCRVAEDNTILGQGSVMGDIKGKGIMTNNIYAQTHVVLLTITSPEFFTIMNNFAETETAFFDAVKDVEDYVKSVYDVPEEVIPQEETEWMVPQKSAESEFELEDNARDFKPMVVDKKTKLNIKCRAYINPNSFPARVLLTVFVLDAIATAFLIPMIMALRMTTFTTRVVVHFLDAIWIVKIFTTFQTAYIETDTGNLISDPKAICKHYLKSVDGFFIDLLCVFPFEYFILLAKQYYITWDWFFESHGYSARLLRLFSLWIRVQKEKRKLSLSDRTRWFIIVMRQIILYNFLTAVNLIIATDEKMVVTDWELHSANYVAEAFLWSFLSMFNTFAGTGLNIMAPTNLIQLVFNILIALFALIERALLTSEALAIINGSLFVKSEKLYKMQLMEKFLAVRDISPALRKSLMKYACDLLLHFKGEVDLWFLQTAPYYIRVQISQDLYLNYLIACYAFHGMPIDFLKQLPARFQRCVFFPSNVITEKGDVDCCMYFVHQGEVVSIERDPIYHGLDYEIQQYRSGDFFGLEQGVSQTVPQTTTFRALTKVDLLILNYFDWEDLRIAFPQVIDILHQNMQTYK